MSLTLILGCKYSGKTTLLMNKATHYRNAGLRVKCVTRSHCDLRSHDDTCMAAECISQLKNISIKNEDVILVDDVERFDNFRNICNGWAFAGKKVVISGRPVPEVIKSIATCDHLIHLNANCSSCTFRTAAFDDKGLPLCRFCI